jgi:hypothetical protein
MNHLSREAEQADLGPAAWASASMNSAHVRKISRTPLCGLALRLDKRKRFSSEDITIFSLHRDAGGLPESGGSRRPLEGQNP